MKPVQYLLLLPLLGISIFLAESRFLVAQREAEFARQKLISWDSRLAEAGAELNDRARSGWALKFMTGSGAGTSDLEELKTLHPALEGTSILGRNRELITGTIERIPLADLALDFDEAIKKRTTFRRLTQVGWFFVVPVFDFNDNAAGYMLSRIKIPAPDGQTNTGIFSPDTDTLVFSGESNLVRADYHQLITTLHREDLKTGGSFTIKLGEYSYNAIYEPWTGENYFLIHLKNQASVFALPGFYFMIFSFMVGLFSLPFAFPALREKLTAEKHLAAQVRTSHEETLQALKTTHAVQRESYLREIEVPERLITDHEIADYREPAPEAPAAETDQSQEVQHFEAHEPDISADEGRYTPEVIELRPMKRDFVFLDPLADKVSAESKYANQEIALSADEQKIRNRALSPELIGLMKDIGGDNEGHPVFKKILQFLSKYSKPEIPDTIYFLNELYFDEVSKSEIDKAIQPAIEMTGCEQVALVCYDSELGCYRMLYGCNVPDTLRHSMYFLKNDEVFLLHPEKTSITVLPPDLWQNAFFAKRFPPEFARSFTSIISVPLAESHFDAYLLFFNQKETEVSESILLKLRKYLNQIGPALKYYCAANSQQKSEDDLTSEIIKEIRTITNSAREPASIIHINFPNAQTSTHAHNIFAEIKDDLTPQERFICCSPEHIIILLKQTDAQKICNNIAAKYEGVTIQSFRYPDEGKNYYSYI